MPNADGRIVHGSQLPLVSIRNSIVTELFATYSTELTEEERELGFEVIEIQNTSDLASSIQAVACRFSPSDQIVKMTIPVIGGACYRHESLKSVSTASGDAAWVPVGRVVFPTAAMAYRSLVGEPSTRTFQGAVAFA